MSALIFSRNFTDPTIVANSYKSSENASYPVSNSYNLDRRRRTWRSAGYFKIVDGSNTLVFRETTGVDLTATITAGEYTSDILTALKTALDAAGASTYTVTRDSTTKRITIVSNGSGGGGIFQLMLTDADSAAMAAVLGFSTDSDLTGALTYTADLLRIHTSEFLLWDLGIPTNPTGFFAVLDRNAPLQLSESAVLKLQGNWTNEWSAPVYEQTLTLSQGKLFYMNKDGFYTGGLRYWRLYIEDKDNSLAYVELGAVALSQHSVLTRGCAVYPLRNEYQDRSSVAYSEGGRTVVAQRNKTQRLLVQWRGLNSASYESIMRDWENLCLHSAFFIALDPNSVSSTDAGIWLKLVKFESSPQTSLDSLANYNISWVLREEL